MTDAAPVTIVPENWDAPPWVAIATLCGIAESAFVKAIPNGTSAGAVSDAGANRKSRASMAITTGLGVGGAVGLTVGAAVGRAVGAAVGLTVGAAVGLAVGPGVGAVVRVGAGVGCFVGDGDWAGPWVAPGASAEGVTGDGLAVAATVGAAAGLPGGSLLVAATDDGLGPIEPGVVALGTGPPQAATSRPAAASRRRRSRGIAAL